MAAAQPVPKRRIRLTGMMGLASNCGDMYVDLIELLMLGLNWALTLKWNVFPPNPVRQNCGKYVLHNKHSCMVSTEPRTPVDPAGPHCCRDRTKTC